MSFVFQNDDLIECMTPRDATGLLAERVRSLDERASIVSHPHNVAVTGVVILRFSHGEIEVP